MGQDGSFGQVFTSASDMIPFSEQLPEIAVIPRQTADDRRGNGAVTRGGALGGVDPLDLVDVFHDLSPLRVQIGGKMPGVFEFLWGLRNFNSNRWFKWINKEKVDVF